MAGLGVLSPWFLLGAIAAIVPVVLHLFRRETAPVQEFSSVQFLRPTAVEQTRQRRLRDLLLLALRIATVLTLALAFARPYVRGGQVGEARRVTMVALDVSASMGATATWDEARRLAREAVYGAPSGPVGLVTFADSARLVVEPVDDRRVVAAAIAAARPGTGGTRFEPAVAAASSAIGGRTGDVVLVSDLQEWALGGGGDMPRGVGLRVARVNVTRNVAITSAERDEGELVAVVENEGPDPFTGSVAFALDGRAIGAVRTSVPARSTVSVRLKASLPASGVATANVNDEAGAPADNRRVVVLDAAARLPVLVVAGRTGVGDPSVYVRSALDAVAGDKMIGVAADVRPPDDPKLADAGFLGGFRAVFLLATRGMTRPARDVVTSFVERGGGLFLAAGPDVDPRVTDELLDAASPASVTSGDHGAWPATLAAADSRHPLVAALGPLSERLVHVRVDRGVRLTPPTEARVVAWFTNGWPALVETRRGRGRVYVFASDLGRQWNSFPLQATFAPFVYEVARDLAGPTDVAGSLTPADVDEGTAVPGTVTRGTPAQRIAVNVDPRESRLATLTPDAVAAAFPPAPDVPATTLPAGDRADVRHDELWRALLLAFGLFLAVDTLMSAARRASAPASRAGRP
jgi:hypothetical protein